MVKEMRMSHVKSVLGSLFAGLGQTGIQVPLRRGPTATCVTFAVLAFSLTCRAGELTISVADRDGHGVGEVVVTATPATGALTPTPTSKSTSVMDQRNLAFAPRVLVVGVGTRVDFPNNDSVSHQVYSFSPAKRFQLPLYKGEFHPPVTFDQSGLVVLGCNIHDSMVGYIYVTPAPYFGTTVDTGRLTLKQLPKGDYQVTIWSPYITDAPGKLSRTVHVEGDESASFALASALRVQPEPRPRRRDWDY
jgi:plastocyanin